MKESILDRVRRCGCGVSYYIGVDGDEFKCDGCLSAEELQDRQSETEVEAFGWRQGVHLSDDGADE